MFMVVGSFTSSPFLHIFDSFIWPFSVDTSNSSSIPDSIINSLGVNDVPFGLTPFLKLLKMFRLGAKFGW